MITEAHTEPSQTVAMRFFAKALKYFCKKAPSLMFDWVLNMAQNQAIIRRSYYHDFLTFQEYQKYCKNDLGYCFGKIF